MKEEIIVSGRSNEFIDPILNIWHWQIPLYLFLGGLAAGLLFFASFYTILGKEKENETAVKWASFIAPIALVVGLFALFLDLRHKLFFWQLYTTIRLESPMSWGAWVLMVITPLSFIWSATYMKELFPKWDWKFKLINDFETFAIKQRKNIAWIMIVLSVLLGVYTGILLSAFNARPLWNTAILGPIFLVSGLSTGAATIMWMSKNPAEKKLFGRIDLILIVIELFLITHMFMGFLAGAEAKIEAVELFLGGEFTFSFWIFVIFLGLLVPATLESLEIRGFHIHAGIPAFLIILGGILFRFIMVEAGQVSHFLY